MSSPPRAACLSLLWALACAASLACGTAATDAPADVPSDAQADTDAAESDAAPATPGWTDQLRPLRSSGLRIIDDLDRDVLLRGVNITSLGEYWQGDPAQPPTMPTTDQDWRAMAAAGLDVVRLVVHWSRIEPERGVIDGTYLDAIDAYVRTAASYGIYTVIDMHQDAYTAFIWTPPGEICPPGTQPARGWDGAPAWAVLTDGLSTCTPGDRNASDAVRTAWNHFYDNTDGIRDHFVGALGAVATRFAGRPEVAGYDVLNEPEVSRPSAELTPLYDRLLLDSIAAIRAAEADAPFEHLIFIEPAIPAGNGSYGIVIPDPGTLGVDTRNVVAAPHNYAETIGIPGLDVSFEEMSALLLGVAAGIGVPTWIGEYGFWSTSDVTLEQLGRYAADEDAKLLHGAWWQWRQPCGDPHSLAETGAHVVVHLHQLGCPGDVDLGPTPQFMRVLGRGYPRAAPGRLDRLVSEPETGRLIVEATATEAGGELLVWTPTTGASHGVTLAGLRDLRATEVQGGRLLRATVSAAGGYSLRVEPNE